MFFIDLVRMPHVLHTDLFNASAALLNGWISRAAEILSHLTNDYK